MENINCSTNNRDYFSNTQPFFIDPYQARQKEHHQEIKNKFKVWQKLNFATDKSFPVDVDLDTFTPDRLKIKAVELINPRANEHNKNLETTEEMALSHLRNYNESYDLYSKIVESQNLFNIKMDNFLKSNMQQLNQIRGFDDIKRFEMEELRYYLIKIVDASRHTIEKEKTWYLKQSFHNILLGGDERIRNPFTVGEEIVIQDLVKRYDEIINSINMFKRDT